jgi:hypothetical protein
MSEFRVSRALLTTGFEPYAQPLQSQPSLGETSRAGTWFFLGLLCSFLSVVVVPEIFGSTAIILGAYVWKTEPGRSRGLIVLVMGILFMLIGIYFTSYFALIDLYPS